MSVGPCGPLRGPEWVWGNLGGQGQGPITTLSPEKQSLCQPFHVSLRSWCVSLSAHAHEGALLSVCVSRPRVSVSTHTSGHATSLSTPLGTSVFI